MDESPQGVEPVTVAGAVGDLQPPGQRRVRRKLVQSTLLPINSREVESNCSEKKADRECNGEEDKDGQDADFCGSQGKKRRTRGRMATTPKPRTPIKPKVKSSKNGTPKRNATGNGKTSAELVGKEDSSPTIPNLRLEAKMTAEENSRRFAGKQLHPFFSLWKADKSSHETNDVENDGCTSRRRSRRTNIGPIHVFERDQDDVMEVDWRNWEFMEKYFTSSDCSLRGSFLANVEASVECPRFNKFPSVSHHSGMSLVEDNASLDQCPSQQENLHEAPVSASIISSDVQVACCQIVDDAQRYSEIEVDEAKLSSSCVRKSIAKHQIELVEERTVSPYLGCANHLEDRLWTDKYRPRKAMEIRGNHEAVKFLSEWLQTWYQRSYQGSKCSFGDDEVNMLDIDLSDSDSEETNEGANLKNVLLITGPVGSGKTAAIYACAREQGFKVLEVNASEYRNGDIVKQRFVEMLESHSFKWSQEDPAEVKQVTKFSTVLPNGKTTQELDNEVVEVIPMLYEDNPDGTAEASRKSLCKDSQFSNAQGQLRPLILFEDVDIIFSEDHGLIAAIKQIARKAKGPVILTSNSDNHVLPHNLDRLEVCFKMPSERELLQHIYMVCIAEKASIQPYIIEELIKCCQGDIRRAIMHLQFWCQGKQFGKDLYCPNREAKRSSGALLFDPDTAHLILPKVIPWGFPSQLSELVEKEITLSLSMNEENHVLVDIPLEEFDKATWNNLDKHGNHTNNMHAKKQAVLSRNFSDQDCIDVMAPLGAACDYLNSLDAPVLVSQQIRHRKLVVMSSESEDEIPKERFPVTSTHMQPCSEVQKLVEHYYGSSETEFDLHASYTCKSVDVSCVPESSFVPETEICNGGEVLTSRMSYGKLADTLENVSVANEYRRNMLSIETGRQNMLSIETGNLGNSIQQIHKDYDLLGSTCDVIGVSSQEEVEDSQNGSVQITQTEYNMMDECSRMALNSEFMPVEKPQLFSVTGGVQESWRKLRSRHTDLRHFIASEHKDSSGIVELAYGMSNLISEAELLVSKCQSLDCLESSMVLSEALDEFSWCDEQLQMTSAIVDYGFCSYAKDIAAAGLNFGSEDRIVLTRETLSATSMMEVNSLVAQDMSKGKTAPADQDTQTGLAGIGSVSNSELKSSLFDIVQSMVPPRSYMMMKGNAFHEYLSSLSLMSRSEAARLSGGTGTSRTKRLRGRAARNYLSSGSLMLFPEEISLLDQFNIYGKST